MKKVILVTGHQKSSKGAVSVTGEAEWDFNNSVMAFIGEDDLAGIGVKIIKINPDVPHYAKPKIINDMLVGSSDIALEFHFNASDNDKATGTEMLYYANSEASRKLAEAMQASVVGSFKSRDRGCKPIASKQDRGGTILISTKCPIIISEPFFGSNPNDCKVFMTIEGKKKYAIAIKKAIAAYYGVIM